MEGHHVLNTAGKPLNNNYRPLERDQKIESLEGNHDLQSTDAVSTQKPAFKSRASTPLISIGNERPLHSTRRSSTQSIEFHQELSRHNSAKSSLNLTLEEYSESGILGLVDAEPSRRHVRAFSPSNLSSGLSPQRLSHRSSKSCHRDSQSITPLSSLNLNNAHGIADGKREVMITDVEKQEFSSSSHPASGPPGGPPGGPPQDPNLVGWDGLDDPVRYIDRRETFGQS